MAVAETAAAVAAAAAAVVVVETEWSADTVRTDCRC